MTLEVSAPDGVQVESLSPYPTQRSAGGPSSPSATSWPSSGSQVVLRLNFPYGEIGRETGAIAQPVRPRRRPRRRRSVKLGWEYADDKANDLQERDRDVDRAVARIFAARARQEAIGLNRSGDFRRAAEALTASRAGSATTPAATRPARDRRRARPRDPASWPAPMPEMSRKQAFFASANVARMRTFDGKATKGPQSGR